VEDKSKKSQAEGIGKINNLNLENYDMDVCFETYINKSLSQAQTQQSNINNILYSNQIFEESCEDKIFYKTKIEILHILSFLLNTYTDIEIVNHDISKFICDLMDTLVEKRESGTILDHINNIFKNLLKIYKKNCLESEIISTPIKIIFCDLIKHILNKLILQNSNRGISNEIRNKYYDYFKEIYYYLKFDAETGRNQNLMNKSTSDITKLYLIELLSLLDEKEQLSFYGFYIR
jgi:hypothetical protein